MPGQGHPQNLSLVLAADEQYWTDVQTGPRYDRKCSLL